MTAREKRLDNIKVCANKYKIWVKAVNDLNLAVHKNTQRRQQFSILARVENVELRRGIFDEEMQSRGVNFDQVYDFLEKKGQKMSKIYINA